MIHFCWFRSLLLQTICIYKNRNSNWFCTMFLLLWPYKRNLLNIAKWCYWNCIYPSYSNAEITTKQKLVDWGLEVPILHDWMIVNATENVSCFLSSSHLKYFPISDVWADLKAFTRKIPELQKIECFHSLG